MIFLSRPEQYPLSVFLASVQPESPGISFVCSILALLPAVLLYLYYRGELMEGLEFMGVK